MSRRIRTIRLKGFRGATAPTEIRFDDSKPIVLLFGENGTGKSTIVDAIGVVCNGELGSLEHRSLDKTNKHPYLASINTNLNDLSVELEVGTDVYAARVVGKKVNCSSDTSAPRVRTLRRRTLLELVEAQGKDRFDALKKFIDIENIRKSERALKEVVLAVREEFDEATRSYRDAQQLLEELWENEGRPSGQNALTWASSETTTDVHELEQLTQELKESAACISDLQMKYDEVENRQAEAVEAQRALDEVLREVQTLANQGVSEAMELKALLEQVQKYFKSHQQNTCPVCEQSVELTSLMESIAARLETFNQQETLSRLEVRKRKAEQDHRAAETVLHSTQNTCMKAAKNLLQYRAMISAQANLEPAFWTEFLALDDPDAPLIETNLVLAKRLVDALSHALQDIEGQYTRNHERISQHNLIKTNYQNYIAKQEEAERLEVLGSNLEKTLQAFTQTRKSFEESFLHGVVDDWKQLYETIHPNESFTISRLELDAQSSGSLRQYATYAGTGKEIIPQAYLSESHLDTFGFTFWLALTKREQPESTILILEDVFTSADAVHMDRIFKLLEQECQHFAQTIVTTHVRRLFEDFRQNKYAPKNVHIIELHDWSPAFGIRAFDAYTALDELTIAVNNAPLDRQKVASASGVLLEWLLDKLAIMFRVKMPRNYNCKYTLEPLLSAAKNTAGTVHRPKRDLQGTPMMPISYETIPIKMQIEKIYSYNFVRNMVGAHFDFDGFNVTNAEVKSFAKEVLELAYLLICQDCGTQVLKGQSCKCPNPMTIKG